MADAQIIEYNQDTEVSLLQIGVKIVQKDNVCTSAHAIYRKKEQTLDMSGNPKIQQGEDTFRAQEISLNLETDEITLDGRVSGTVTDTKKEKEEPKGEGEGEPNEELPEIEKIGGEDGKSEEKPNGE